MQDNLSELLERVQLCEQRSQELQARIVQLAGESISHWLFPWRQPGVGQIKAKLLAHPSVSLRQEVGMIVNEQRAILDALACKLAGRNGANHTSDVYFPITRSKAGFYDELGQRKIRKLSDADRASIEALRPWCPSDEDPEDGDRLLFQLHESDRVRKHQNLLKWAFLGGVFPEGSGYIDHLQAYPVVLREVGKEESLAFFSGITFGLGVQFEVVYVEPAALDGFAVGPLLSAFNDRVAEIVRRFA